MSWIHFWVLCIFAVIIPHWPNDHCSQQHACLYKSNLRSVCGAIVFRPPSFGYHCAPPLNSKYIANFENLFAPTEGAACKPCLSKTLSKYTDDIYLWWIAFYKSLLIFLICEVVVLRNLRSVSGYSQIKNHWRNLVKISHTIRHV